ncbi:MAG TPA: hypothetical protein VFV96_09920 [Verrucomicrobiae bacterium]|nr:hypothetical protein [Verrucomicrobiae bacterium]
MTFRLALLAAICGRVCAASVETNSAAPERILLIDPSSMPVAAGKATLTIGPLQRANGVYAGDYQFKVIPYFWKNETGRLPIAVSDAKLAEIGQGKTVAITGTAVTSGEDGKSRPIAATATPVDPDHGKLKLWFTAGKRKMLFEPAYQFVGQKITGDLAETHQL